MTAKHEPIKFYAGDTWEISGQLTDANGGKLDLTGATIAWKLDDFDGVKNILTLGVGSGITIVDPPSDGNILIATTPDSTKDLSSAVYRDELRVTLSDGTVTTQWAGAIIVSSPIP